MNEEFQPPWWLRNNHIQSCYSVLCRSKEGMPLHWEELNLPDGDFIDLCWAEAPPAGGREFIDKAARPEPVPIDIKQTVGSASKNSYRSVNSTQPAPIVVLLHGLEGSVKSWYMQAMLDIIYRMGWRSVSMHFRSCGGRMNRLSRLYSAGDFADLDYLLRVISQREPDTPILAVGFSVGGNVLLKYLAHELENPVQVAVAVSVPFEVGLCADYLSQFYEWRLLYSMKSKIKEKLAQGQLQPVDLETLRGINSLRIFDRYITAPMFGYRNEDHYYSVCSSRATLGVVNTPSLLIHALDDPFIPPTCLPEESELGANMQLRVYDVGGHLGFVSGGLPWSPEVPIMSEIAKFLQQSLD